MATKKTPSTPSIPVAGVARTIAPAPKPTPARTPAPTQVVLGGQTVTVPASFGAPAPAPAPSAPIPSVQQQIATVAQVVAQVVTNMPAVVDTPKNTAPELKDIQPIVAQTIVAIAPVVAPSLPPVVLQNIADNIENAIVSSPQIKKSDIGEIVPPQIVNKIAESATKTVISEPETKTSVADYATQLGQYFGGVAPVPAPTTVPDATPVTESAPMPTVAPAPVLTPAPTPIPTQTASAQFPTAMIGSQQITAPENFGLPTASVPTSTVPSSTTKKSESKPTPAPTQVVLGGQTVTVPESFGAPAVVPTTISPANDNYATELGRYFGGVGPAPSSVTGPSDIQQKINQTNQVTTGPTGPIDISGSTGPTGPASPQKKIVSTFTNDKGQQIAVYDDGSTSVIGQAVDKIAERKSAFDLLKQEFTRYGLGALVGDTLTLAQEGVSPAEFSLRLRQLPSYQSRFAANDIRIKNGLSALSESQYIALEDRYQQIMQEYGVPKSFYAQQADSKTGIMKQPELEKIIAGDVSPVELETRINTAINRVKNASPEVMSALQQFYPGVTQENLVAYVLDPIRALPDIQRQVQAAEVGGMATRFGLAASRASAEQLAAAGVTKEQAQQGYQTIAEMLPRGSQLASIYKESPYTQATAEQEVFGTAGAAEATKQRKKLTQLEQASFSGQSGMGALARDRAGAF